jgi:hypothetical protein
MRSRRVGNPSNGTRAGINVSTDTLPPGCKHADENPKGSCKNLGEPAYFRLPATVRNRASGEPTPVVSSHPVRVVRVVSCPKVART